MRPCSSSGLVTQAWCLMLHILMMMPGISLQAQKNNKETVRVMTFYKEPHMNGCTKCHNTGNRSSVLLQRAAVLSWHVITANVFLAKFRWIWKSRTSLTNFTNQGDMQIKRKCPHIPQSLTYLAVGKTVRWLRKKALRKQYLPTWLAQPWARRPLTERGHNTVFFAREETRAYCFRPCRIWTSANVKISYQCLLDEVRALT